MATPGDYFGELGPLFGLPRSAMARARTQAIVTGYTVQAFREQLGQGDVDRLIEHRELTAAPGGGSLRVRRTDAIGR